MIPIAKPYLTEEEAQVAYDTVLSGWVTQGPRVKEFEDKFSKYVGAKHSIAVSSCTTALHLALEIAQIQEESEVICPSTTFIATANAIRYVQAKPIFAEVNEFYNLDINDVIKKITSKTKAILLVHQIGIPADIDAFRNLCDEKNLILIEDAACAIGSKYKGKPIGSHSDLVCFSFHPRKIVTTGDGGMITTTRQDFADRARILRQHGMSVNDRLRHMSSKLIFEDYVELGYNYRMTDIQGAIGIRQLEKLDFILEQRRRIAEIYNKAFGDIKCLNIVKELPGYEFNYQSYPIYLKPSSPISRNQLMQSLLDDGISTRRGIMNIHTSTAYNNGIYALPISEDLEKNSLLIPLFVPMSDEEINYVIDKVKYYLNT